MTQPNDQSTPGPSPRAGEELRLLRERAAYRMTLTRDLTDEAIADLEVIRDLLNALAAQGAEVEAACDAVCQDNLARTVGTPDTELTRWLCLNEDGDPIIEADTPAEVIRGLSRCWGSTEERAEKAESLLRAAAQGGEGEGRPTVVCLCGSTRVAREQFTSEYARLTDEGCIVLSVGRLQPIHGWDAAHKARLDELHLRKIDLASHVHVLNVGGYIGESTRREIAYAEAHGKTLTYLEPPNAPPISLRSPDHGEGGGER